MHVPTDPRTRLVVRRLGLGSELVDYRVGWQLQAQLHAAVVAGEMPATALLLEHQEVFTAGKRTRPEDRPSDGSEVIEVDRGGRITWHGPGQLVCYPIVRLPQALDVVAHVRRLEEVVMLTCADFGIATKRIDGRSGVWIDSGSEALTANAVPDHPDRKIAAVGVRVARGVTMHGIALNVDCDLAWTDRIVACGIADAEVTSMAEVMRSQPGTPREVPSLTVVADSMEQKLITVLGPTLSDNPDIS